MKPKQMSLRVASAIVATCFSAAESAHALGKVSRACQYSTIPNDVLVLNMVTLSRTQLPGANRYEAYSWFYCDAFAEEDRCDYWALESFTTDYTLGGRYHLWVTAETWEKYWPQNCVMSSLSNFPAGTWMTSPSYPWCPSLASLQDQYNSYWPFREYYSGWLSDWSQSELPTMLAFVLVRARAGTGSYPYFFEKLGGNKRYKIKGWHYYYDPRNAFFGNLGTSTATDCNLKIWGFEKELYPNN